MFRGNCQTEHTHNSLVANPKRVTVLFTTLHWTIARALRSDVLCHSTTIVLLSVRSLSCTVCSLRWPRKHKWPLFCTHAITIGRSTVLQLLSCTSIDHVSIGMLPTRMCSTRVCVIVYIMYVSVCVHVYLYNNYYVCKYVCVCLHVHVWLCSSVYENV